MSANEYVLKVKKNLYPKYREKNIHHVFKYQINESGGVIDDQFHNELLGTYEGKDAFLHACIFIAGFKNYTTVQEVIEEQKQYDNFMIHDDTILR